MKSSDIETDQRSEGGSGVYSACAEQKKSFVVVAALCLRFCEMIHVVGYVRENKKRKKF